MLCLSREEGQSLTEYSFILLMVVLVVIAMLMILGPQVGNMYSRITNGLMAGG